MECVTFTFYKRSTFTIICQWSVTFAFYKCVTFTIMCQWSVLPLPSTRVFITFNFICH